jgi:hypothetical protein
MRVPNCVKHNTPRGIFHLQIAKIVECSNGDDHGRNSFAGMEIMSSLVAGASRLKKSPSLLSSIVMTPIVFPLTANSTFSALCKTASWRHYR